MSRIMQGAGAMLLATTSLASAGALDRSGQPVGVIFEDGNYVELSYGFTSPDVQGSFTNPVSGAVSRSGDVGLDFDQVTLSFKYDLNDRLSVAVILDQPFGADVNYANAELGYPVRGSEAVFETSSITALGRYKLNDSFSVHAGARSVRVDADLYVQTPTLLNPADPTTLATYYYDGNFDADSDLGYVVGAAYERQEIGLRVALTYSSETSFSNGTSFAAGILGVGDILTGSGQTSYTLPQSVNLDFRTGIAADTAIFGSIRWVDWSSTQINVPGRLPDGRPAYPDNPVVGYDEDIVTYTLGIGRRFSDQLTASAAVIYEPATGSDFSPAVARSGVSNLAPTDGQLGLQLAATYALNDSLELTGGVRYTRLGDATTRGFGASFEGNDAVSLGLRVGYRF